VAGNDLVDLKQAARDSNWQRTGYLHKICTAEEEQLILSAADPHTMLWLIWTMKEASYKVVNRLSGMRSYAPRSFVCSGLNMQGSSVRAFVAFNEFSLFINAEVSTEMVHTVAVLREEELGQLQTHYLNYTPGYVSDFNQSHPEYILSKNGAGLPQVRQLPGPQILEASVSHHGRYAAIVFSAPLYAGSPQ